MCPASAFVVKACLWIALVSFGLITTASAQFKTIINIPDDQPSIAGEIGSNTQLNVFEGGIVESFFAAGAADGSSSNVEVNIYGGEVGLRFDANHCDVNVFGGDIVGSFDASYGSRVRISGGNFGSGFDADHSTLKISGGIFAGGWDVCFCQLTISGGQFGDGFYVLPATRVDITGGSIGQDFRLFPQSEIHLYGQGFAIDGVEIPGLIPGQAHEITERGGAMLEGTLIDGTLLSFQLNSSFVPGEDFFAADGIVTVTVLDQVLPGDVNRDGTVSLLDVIPLVELLSAGGFQLEADVNCDGGVSLRDIAPLIQLLSG